MLLRAALFNNGVNSGFVDLLRLSPKAGLCRGVVMVGPRIPRICDKRSLPSFDGDGMDVAVVMSKSAKRDWSPTSVRGVSNNLNAILKRPEICQTVLG